MTIPAPRARGGKNVSELKDPNSLALFVEFVKTVRKGGAGCVDYLWPRPGSAEPEPKRSYVKGFEPWGWVVGSGVFQSGSTLVPEAGGTMTEIVSLVRRMAEMINAVTAATGEQSNGIGQLNTSVVQLDRMARQNAALVEESTTATKSLTDQTSRLTEVLKTFRL